MKIVDRICGWLLVLGGLLHSMGCFAVYRGKPELLLWSQSATLAGLLLAAINLIRVRRPADRVLAWLSFAGCVGWLIFVYAFGRVFGNMLDFRVLTQGGITLLLAYFSLRSALRSSAVRGRASA